MPAAPPPAASSPSGIVIGGEDRDAPVAPCLSDGTPLTLLCRIDENFALQKASGSDGWAQVAPFGASSPWEHAFRLLSGEKLYIFVARTGAGVDLDDDSHFPDERVYIVPAAPELLTPPFTPANSDDEDDDDPYGTSDW
jgi:hypothetical protein